MNCNECNEKLELTNIGFLSLNLCYECPLCGNKEVYMLGLSEGTREDVVELLNNSPMLEPEDVQREWLKKLDSLLG